jgi:peptidoglycan/xylan/chitin deacetylase (PgdA/CDA1 family)
MPRDMRDTRGPGIMMGPYQRRRWRGAALVALLAAVVVTGCAAEIATTREATPTPATASPTAAPAAPTATPAAPCAPSSGVSAVSPVEISRGTTSRPQITLTFDAGADAGPAPRLLDILAAHHVHSTWFVTGQWAARNPTLLRRVRDEGHEIANHTVHHLDLTTLSDVEVCRELTQADTTIMGITGKTTRPYFRPPFGARNLKVRTLAANLGYRTIYWTIDTLDWRADATTDSIRARVLNNVGNGAIILMHVGSQVEADTLDGLMTTLEGRGYAMVTLSQALA